MVTLSDNLFLDFNQAAKETGMLQEAKSKLEKYVEELTWQLQLEKRMRVICCLYLYLHFCKPYHLRGSLFYPVYHLFYFV